METAQVVRATLCSHSWLMLRRCAVEANTEGRNEVI
jgi:hypothetical protein